MADFELLGNDSDDECEFDVRRRTTRLSSIRVVGDPNAPVTSIPSFLSPTSVLAPRVVRLNVTYKFDGFGGLSTGIGSGLP